MTTHTVPISSDFHSQLLVLWGVQRSGFVEFSSSVIVGTALFAVASWWLVERHALRLKRVAFPMLIAKA